MGKVKNINKLKKKQRNSTMKGKRVKTDNKYKKTRNKKKKLKGGFSIASFAGCGEGEILAHGAMCPISYKLNPVSNPMGCCIKKTKPSFQLGGGFKKNKTKKTRKNR